MTLSAMIEEQGGTPPVTPLGKGIKVKREPPSHPPRRTKARSESGSGAESGDSDEEWVMEGDALLKQEGASSGAASPKSEPLATGDDMEAEPVVVEAAPGVGIKVVMVPDSPVVSRVELGFKALCPSVAEHTAIGYAALDTSQSMKRNGGEAGLRNVITNFADMATDLPDECPPVTLGAFCYDVRQYFAGDKLAGPETAIYPIREWDKPMVEGGESLTAGLIETINSRGGGTDILNAIGFGLDRVCDKLMALPEAQRKKTVGTILLCTDGMAYVGGVLQDTNSIRKRVDDRIRDTGLCIIVMAIALGTGPDSTALQTICGKTGIASWAMDPANAGEAFISTFERFSKTKGIFNAEYAISRRNTHTNEYDVVFRETKQFGFLTANNVLESLTIDKCGSDDLKIGDKIEVTFQGATYSTTIGDADATNAARDDIFDELAALKQVKDKIDELTAASSTNAKAAIVMTQELAALTAQRTTSSAVRSVADAFQKAVFRSLSSQASPQGSQESPPYVQRHPAATYGMTRGGSLSPEPLGEDITGDQAAYRSLGGNSPMGPPMPSRMVTGHAFLDCGSQAFYAD